MTYMPWISFKTGYTNCFKKKRNSEQSSPNAEAWECGKPHANRASCQKFRGVWAILNGKRKQSKETLLIVLYNSQTKFEPSKLHIPSTLLMTFTSAPLNHNQQSTTASFTVTAVLFRLPGHINAIGGKVAPSHRSQMHVPCILTRQASYS